MCEKIVYIIDDESKSCEFIKTLTDSANLRSESFSSPIDFLNTYNTSYQGCIVLDVHMPTMSGLELQKELNNRGCTLPIIFITGFGEVSTAVEAMKAGAIEFFEKPFDGESLLVSIQAALEYSPDDFASGDDSIEKRLASLTPRENEIMNMLANGMTNKEIAKKLNISHRTVEVHRQHIMKKLQLKSVQDLVELLN